MIQSIAKIEIELSSRCNASCPGCLRTILDNQNHPFPKLDLNFALLKESLVSVDLQSTVVKLCGVLGDPMVHPKVVEVVNWLVEKAASVEISTNGSLGKKEIWKSLAEISKKTKKLWVMFSVDGIGETNAIYRRGTRYATIENNMAAYSLNGGFGRWVFIDFDHNTHQKEEARKRASVLGLEFYVRRAIRNSFPNLSDQQKTEQFTAILPETAHVAVERAIEINQSNERLLQSESISCKYKDGKELFIAANGTLWPCCFLWDEFHQPHSQFPRKVRSIQNDPSWNELGTQKISEILKNPFFANIESLWSSGDSTFVKRCYKSCGAKGALHNSFSQV